MAQTEQKKPQTQQKRLARAKIRRPQTPEEVAKTKADRKKRIRNIAISIFAVVLVLAMMVPSFAAIVNSARQAHAVSQAQSGEVTSEQIDAMYQTSVDEAVAALAASPNDTETLLEVANQYLSWGYMVSNYATDDGAATHASELLDMARDYFDRYLELDDSADVKANRALCDLYQGNLAAAQEALEAVVADAPDCASAWANLGMIYELTNPDGAAVAYQRAIDADTSEDGSASSFAQGRLDALQAAAKAAESETSETAQDSSETAPTDTDAETSGTSN